jgi:hypothetical protein
VDFVVIQTHLSLWFLIGPSTSQSDAAFTLLCANFNALLLDFVARQNEQLPIVPLAQYAAKRFGRKSAAEIVREAVLELTYTSQDMAAFARDMGYLNAKGKVKPPFRWDEDRRRMHRAKLDAVYFHLYGVTDRDDVRYVYSTFSIIEGEENRHSWTLSLA